MRTISCKPQENDRHAQLLLDFFRLDSGKGTGECPSVSFGKHRGAVANGVYATSRSKKILNLPSKSARTAIGVVEDTGTGIS